jgi:hypothetical protein
MKAHVAAVIVAVVLCGCGKPPEQRKVELGVNFAASNLDAVNKNPMAAISFGSLAEQGGTVLTYLSACMPNNDDLPHFTEGKPDQPWCVVIKPGPGESDYTIEGYGTDLAKPMLTRTVTLKPIAVE